MEKKFENAEHIVIQPIKDNKPYGKVLNNTYIIKNLDKGYSASYWRLELKDIPENKRCKFSVEYAFKQESEKAYVVVYQFNKEGKEVSADYLTKTDEKNVYDLDIEMFSDTDKFVIELMFYSFGEGSIEFKNLEVEFSDKKPHRIVNVATTYFEQKWHNNCEANIPQIISLIDKAAKDKNKPDILCFTETVYDRGTYVDFEERLISNDHEIIQQVRNKAKEYKMHIIFTYHEIDENGYYYNTAVVISDRGEIVGKYQKAHLCYTEIKRGMVPERNLPVIELPFGKIGIMICWDQWFPEHARELVDKGAEILFICTAGNPIAISRARSQENGVFTVVSGCQSNNPSASFITDDKGDILASVENGKDYVCVPIDLDEHKYMPWLSFLYGYGNDLYKIDRRNNLYTYLRR